MIFFQQILLIVLLYNTIHEHLKNKSIIYNVRVTRDETETAEGKTKATP